MTGETTEAPQAEIIADTSAVGQLARAEIDTQIATARQFPRDLGRYKQSATSMATLDRETAESCMYALPRGRKMISGPSVRLAEIVASAWGNLRIGERIAEVGDTYVVAQGVCHDLQTNTSKTTEVRRRITDKNGRRYNEDMIVMTCNAACSLAGRNAVFKVVPRALVDPIYDAARKTAVGDAATLEERRQAALSKFALMGITEERLLARVEKESVEAIDLKDLEALIGLYTAIRDGSTKVDEAFPLPEVGGSDVRATLDKIKNKGKGKAEPGAQQETAINNIAEAKKWAAALWAAAKNKGWTREELLSACEGAVSTGAKEADLRQWIADLQKEEVLAHVESTRTG